MKMPDSVIPVHDLVEDKHIRVFRRYFSAPGEFDSMQVDAYIIISRHYVVVCDTLLCPEDVASMLHTVHSELSGRQLIVINSHADWDHCWGNCYFTGTRKAPIIAHERCRERLQSAEAQAELADYQARFATFQQVALTPPDQTFTQRYTIHDDDLTLELLSAPGHCADHLAVWIPELRLLLAFDAVEYPLPQIENAQGVRPMLTTLERFLALQPRTVLCSHGKINSPVIIAENLVYVRAIERRCHLWLATHQATSTDLAHAATLIGYPSTEAVARPEQVEDPAFYRSVHEQNVAAVLQWVMMKQDQAEVALQAEM